MDGMTHFQELTASRERLAIFITQEVYGYPWCKNDCPEGTCVRPTVCCLRWLNEYAEGAKKDES